MSIHGVLSLAVVAYFSVNFVLALALHIHAEHQAHLPHRFLDVLVHFVLLTAFAVPVLLVITFEALFGGHGEAEMAEVVHARAA